MGEKNYLIDNAELMSEWDWEENYSLGLDSRKLSIGSQKVASWICSTHREKFKQIIRARARGQRGCITCLREYKSSINRARCNAGKKVLAETHPHLVSEWLECDNSQITPYTCVSGSNAKVKWKCNRFIHMCLRPSVHVCIICLSFSLLLCQADL